MPVVDALKTLVWERSGGICGICGQPVSWAEMQMDHIVPQADGGPHTLENLRAAHGSCNRRRKEGHKRGAEHWNWQGGPSQGLRLPADLREQLERIAREEHRTLTNLILHALSEWLAGRGRGSR